MLKKSALDKCVEGVRVCRGALMINNLLFVDDNLIVCKANHVSYNQRLSLIKQYALASSQYINIDKTTMIFSRNVKKNVKEEIMAIWGCRGVTQYEE